ncbi:nuclear transport factor 2 family protein [Flavihumibacter petaseus]|uniref:DUF4440 domain-containing protein n=1 Tax=Flavihumibacter petaseus NBRC 106054 TaxID=1220578 RepID=A0A0E9N1Q4_9BACT|nr:nuclear transport factor 2 family protein [Flavihumibacter petaseus]GAO43947.1 hypothetical protein FPE01S_02_10530 [Flavihumibacter petaseus NBRC 106054]
MKIRLALIASLMSSAVFAQNSDEEGIKSSVNQLFTGMKTGDTALLAGSFAPGAVLQTIRQKKDGSVSVETEDLKAFVTSVGKPHPDVYDEQIEFGKILVDGNLASVWTPYKFYVGKNFSHCGVNSFQLVKIAGTWKIQYIIDTRRKTGCE